MTSRCCMPSITLSSDSLSGADSSTMPPPLSRSKRWPRGVCLQPSHFGGIWRFVYRGVIAWYVPVLERRDCVGCGVIVISHTIPHAITPLQSSIRTSRAQSCMAAMIAEFFFPER